MLVLGEAARQQGHSECIDVEQQHEAHLTARVDGRWPNPLAHLSQRHLSQLVLMAGGLTHSRTSRSAVFTPKNREIDGLAVLRSECGARDICVRAEGR